MTKNLSWPYRVPTERAASHASMGVAQKLWPGWRCGQSGYWHIILESEMKWADLLAIVSEKKKERKKRKKKQSKTYLWWISCTPHHLLNHRRPHLLLRLTHSNSHIWQKRRMSDVWGVTVTYDIGYPLVLGCIGVTRTNITGLQGLEILKCAKFISHFDKFSVVLVDPILKSR